VSVFLVNFANTFSPFLCCSIALIEKKTIIHLEVRQLKQINLKDTAAAVNLPLS